MQCSTSSHKHPSSSSHDCREISTQNNDMTCSLSKYMLVDKVSYGTVKAVYNGHPSTTGCSPEVVSGCLYSTRPPLQCSKIHITGEISIKNTHGSYIGASPMQPHDQRRCDTGHELLTQRALFLYWSECKKGHAESAFRDACHTS